MNAPALPSPSLPSTVYHNLNSTGSYGLTPNGSRIFFLRYFSEHKKQLSLEIRKIALEGAKPDPYMRTLLTILRAVDNLHYFDDPFLQRHFKSEEYKAAKAKIKEVVMYNA